MKNYLCGHFPFRNRMQLDEYIDELKASVNKNDDKNRLIVKFFINAKSKIILF